MPNSDGIDFLSYVRENSNFRKLPFILLTTIEDDEIYFKALDLGVSEFINKPFRPEELKLRIKNLIFIYQYQQILQNENISLNVELHRKNIILEKNLKNLEKCTCRT